MNNFIFLLFLLKIMKRYVVLKKFTLTLLIVKRQGQWRSGRD